MVANANFKSISVSVDTHKQLESLAKNQFEVPVSIQTLLDFLLKNKTPRYSRKRKTKK